MLIQLFKHVTTVCTFQFGLFSGYLIINWPSKVPKRADLKCTDCISLLFLLKMIIHFFLRTISISKAFTTQESIYLTINILFSNKAWLIIIRIIISHFIKLRSIFYITFHIIKYRFCKFEKSYFIIMIR